MAGPRGSSEETRARILRVARELFAERGVNAVSVRDVASEAGVNHALVHRYFGTKEEMIEEILRREARALGGSRPRPDDLKPDSGLDRVRSTFEWALTDGRTTIQLMLRAELAGLEPEKMLEGETRPLGVLADLIALEQSREPREGTPDPQLAAAVIGGALYALVNMSPWLMTAVGLEPEDYDARREEILDTLTGFVRDAAFGVGEA